MSFSAGVVGSEVGRDGSRVGLPTEASQMRCRKRVYVEYA